MEVVAQHQQMYNLTVDEAHTFFVGAGQWLVHNACTSEYFQQITRRGDTGVTDVTSEVTVGGQDLHFQLEGGDRQFADDLLSRHTNYHLYRTPNGQGLGDFLVIDMSNPLPQERNAWLIEVKAPTGNTAPYLNEGSAQIWQSAMQETRLLWRGQFRDLGATPDRLLEFFGG